MKIRKGPWPIRRPALPDKPCNPERNAMTTLAPGIAHLRIGLALVDTSAIHSKWRYIQAVMKTSSVSK